MKISCLNYNSLQSKPWRSMNNIWVKKKQQQSNFTKPQFQAAPYMQKVLVYIAVWRTAVVFDVTVSSRTLSSLQFFDCLVKKATLSVEALKIILLPLNKKLVIQCFEWKSKQLKINNKEL